MEEATREDIALFRYNLIYPLLKENYQEATKQDYMENIANQLIQCPDGKMKHIRPGTLRDWCRFYQQKGFDGLKPKKRADQGNSRSLTADQKIEVLRLKQENPRRTATSIRRTMIQTGYFPDGACSESTVQRFLKANKGSINQTIEDMRAFEMEHVNELWQLDTSHGPYITVDNRNRKTYIVAIVDDASRFVVGADIYFEDNALNVQQTLKKSIQTFGLPNRIYCDNGKPYKNKQLNVICANLGIGINHAAPYHGNQKGYDKYVVM